MRLRAHAAAGILAGLLALGAAACDEGTPDDPMLEETGPGATGDPAPGSDQEDFDDALDPEGDLGSGTGGTADDAYEGP
jgi:hypothetical protein